MTKHIFKISIILVIAVVIYFTLNQTTEIVDIGDRAYNFKLTDIDNNQYELVDYEGKIVVLNFFNTWCEPCIKEGPELESFHHEYQDIATLFIIDKGETDEQVRNYIELYNYEAIYLLDYDLSVSKAFKVVGQPETIIIDQNGIIREHIYGEVTKEILVEKINQYR